MPSTAFRDWRTARAATLNGIEDAHRALRGRKSVRRVLTQQLTQFYAVTLSSQFQAFCRDLHTECARLLVVSVTGADLKTALYDNAVYGRKIDVGNPNPGNIGTDFNRFGLLFWPAVDLDHPRNPRRKALLDELNAWRNAIAHESYTPSMLKGGRVVLPLSRVRRWRKACDGLARSFDNVLRRQLLRLTGVAPW
jgi:hypothetical protein